MSVVLAIFDSLPLLAVSIPALFVTLLAVGRHLKRKHGVPLGIFYQMFAVVFSCWLPMVIYGQTSKSVAPLVAEIAKHLHAAVTLTGMFVLIALVRRFFWELWFEKKYQMKAPKFLSDLGALILFTIAIFVAISLERGEPITGIAVGSTLLAAILGLALQDLLGNIIAGIALEIGKPFRSGDWLIIDDKRMEVIEVNWRSTRLRDNDDVSRDIPNKNVAGATIVNLTFPTRQHAIRILVGFDYSAQPNFVKDRMQRAALQAIGVLQNPPPKVFLKSFGDSAINYEIKFYIEDESRFNDILDSVHTNVWYEAQRSNLRIPFPIRTLQIERGANRKETDKTEARGIFRKQPAFQILDEQQTERLLRSARILQFGRGERIIQQGADGDSMFIFRSGTADVLVGEPGVETKVASLGAGDCCGEMSLLTGEPRSASVAARSDCEVWEVQKADMAEILQNNQALVGKLSEMLARRRIENEGILASTLGKAQMESREKEYTENFFKRLYSFFEL